MLLERRKEREMITGLNNCSSILSGSRITETMNYVKEWYRKDRGLSFGY